MTAIDLVPIEVTLRLGETAQLFTSSKILTFCEVVLKPASGKTALRNISFLVADGDQTCEDLLVGSSVSQYFRIDSNILFETSCRALDGIDCPYPR